MEKRIAKNIVVSSTTGVSMRYYVVPTHNGISGYVTVEKRCIDGCSLEQLSVMSKDIDSFVELVVSDLESSFGDVDVDFKGKYNLFNEGEIYLKTKIDFFIEGEEDTEKVVEKLLSLGFEPLEG